MSDDTVPSLLHVVLVEPEIPQNTGTIGRVCAATHAVLHLVGKLGFSTDDKYLKRAQLDYWPHIRVEYHDTLEQALSPTAPDRVFYFSAKAERSYTAARFREGDYLVFGKESVGLPEEVLETNRDRTYAIPIFGPVRSINLSNAVSVIVYEALRQVGKV
jgi:tRNA (cytidine/uridine-2'-O-)-methyltransferase